MTRYRILLTITGMIFALLVSCGEEQADQQAYSEPVSVKTMTVEVQPAQLSSSYAGSVEALEKVRLSTRISGWVDAIHVAEGDAVRKGAVLVSLRNQDLKAKLAQAQAAIQEAEVYYANMEKNLKRTESLFAQQAATQKELEDMQAAFASAKSGRERAYQMKNEVEEYLQYALLKAPFDGIVTRKYVEVGDLANPGQPIIEVENIRQAKIVAKVPEREISQLQLGMPVSIEVSARGKSATLLTGAVDQIVPAADPMSRQFEIKVLVDNPGGQLKSGMFARIALKKAGDSTIFIPASAIFRRGQLEGVYIADDQNRAVLRWVRSGADFGNQTEILSGLNPGDRLIISKVDNLSDGQPVEVSP